MSEAEVSCDKAVYFAANDISQHNFNMSWCMYFNRNMVIDNQFELPYELVKQGKWKYESCSSMSASVTTSTATTATYRTNTASRYTAHFRSQAFP